MWTTILGLVMGGLPAVMKSIGETRAALAKAETEQEKAQLEAELGVLNTRAQALAKQQDNPWTLVAQFLLLAPVAIYWFQTMAWDKVMCPKWAAWRGIEAGPYCTTDPLADWQILYVTMIMTFFFAGVITNRLRR